jgi:serine O-acetyltransferase
MKIAGVGSHCRIHPGSCLGWHNGKVPNLGNHCYVGPGANLFGGVILGDNPRVGANAVVNKSFPEGNVTLIGSPRDPPVMDTGWETASARVA